MAEKRVGNEWHCYLQTLSTSEYRRFVEEGLQARGPSPLDAVVERVLFGSAEWVKRMRHVLE